MSPLPAGPYASLRWSTMIAMTVFLEGDPCNVSVWAAHIGMSPSALRTRCTAVQLSVKQSLDFARMLRIVIQHDGQYWRPSDSLNVVDPRTLHRLISQSGIPSAARTAPDLESFLASQHFITDAELLRHFRAVLAHCLQIRSGTMPPDIVPYVSVHSARN